MTCNFSGQRQSMSNLGKVTAAISTAIKYSLIASLLVVLASCSPYKYYSKSDFRFYNGGLTLEGPLPRTQGVYVLDKVYTKRSGYIADQKFKGHIHFYKFFKTGQQNSYLVLKEGFDGGYQRVVRDGAKDKAGDRTLFQGYYKLNGDHIILEGVNAALGKFHYTHGKIFDDRLEIISTNTDGAWDFDASNLNDQVVYTYVFKSFDDENYQEVKVDW